MYSFSVKNVDFVRYVHAATGQYPNRTIDRKIPTYAMLETLQYYYDNSTYQLRRYKVFKKLLSENIVAKHKIIRQLDNGNYDTKYLYWFDTHKLYELYGIKCDGQMSDTKCSPASESMIQTIKSVCEDETLAYVYGVASFINTNQLSHKSDRHFTINKEGKMRFTPKGKMTVLNYDDNWCNDNKYRQDIKVGKGLRKMFQSINYPVSDSMIELLSNKIKAKYTFVGKFEIVEGEEIKRWYHGDNYARNQASLSNSCMRYSSCQDFLDIYVDNPETVRMLIAVDPDDKLIGRALVWHTDEDIQYMDRIYGNDITIQAFKNHAHKMGWSHKYKQDYNDSSYVLPNGTIESDILNVSLKNNATEFPYMDTFKYTDDFDNPELFLSTSDGEYCLDTTDGSVPSTIVLHDGTRCHEDQARYVEYEGEYYHEDDVVYSDHRGEYLVYDTAVEVEGDWYPDDSQHICYAEDDDEWHLIDDCGYSEMDGCWYYEYTDCVINGVIALSDSRTIDIGDSTFIIHEDVTTDDLVEMGIITEEQLQQYEEN